MQTSYVDRHEALVSVYDSRPADAGSADFLGMLQLNTSAPGRQNVSERDAINDYKLKRDIDGSLASKEYF